MVIQHFEYGGGKALLQQVQQWEPVTSSGWLYHLADPSTIYMHLLH